MQFMWFFISVFCGIMGGAVVLKFLYSAAVRFFAGLYGRAEKERGYGRKS